MSRSSTFRGLVVSLTIIFALPVMIGAHPAVDRSGPAVQSASIDNTTWIDANKIFMFVTNHGNFGRDLSDFFGFDYGTFYPYTSTADIADSSNISSPLYAAGLWLGGVDQATNDTVVVVSEFSSEFVPGPMLDGTFQTDQPEFRVYKLYRDSLKSNPNQDYLDWPADQGAPVDGEGKPAMMGEQMLWSVFNDADPARHDNNNGQTAPLFVEVQQTCWAYNSPGDIVVPIDGSLWVTAPSEPTSAVRVTVVDPAALTGHQYQVATDTISGEMVWNLIDLLTNDTLIVGFYLDSTNTQVTDGFVVTASASPQLFTSFEVVANGNGPIDPPESGAAPWEGFPVPTGVDPDGYPTDGQQVGDGLWLISTGSSGGTDSGGEDRGPYDTWLNRVFRGDHLWGGGRAALLSNYDWEIRFTGSYDNPGVGGSYLHAPTAFGLSGAAVWVPFELWRIGIDTPDDPSDDLKCFGYTIGDKGDSLFWMSSYGNPTEEPSNCGPGGCEHEISGGYDDPYTDWFYWTVPNDETLPDAGYQAFETIMLSDPASYDFESADQRVMDRLVLVNWNGDTTFNAQGGATVPSGYNQDMPEQGTVFRLVTGKVSKPGDVFTINTVPLDSIMVGPNQMAVYMKYKLINKGSRNLADVFAAIWQDPDLGGAGDDLVGCDSAEGIAFCYNGSNQDQYYGYTVPAVGVKLIEGPVVPSPGNTAYVDGLPIADHVNRGMYAFRKFMGGEDPDNYQETYMCLHGLDPRNAGKPLVYNNDTVRHQFFGDPVTGTGWLDAVPNDRRSLASYGPFDFAPGDTQQFIIKLAVGHGFDRLSSIEAMRAILEYTPTPMAVEDPSDLLLPKQFAVHQNYPNPFNPTTLITYDIPKRTDVEVVVINILGQKVKTLFSGNQPVGRHTVEWDGTDSHGNDAATGVYFYRVKAGDNQQTRKMMLLK